MIKGFLEKTLQDFRKKAGHNRGPPQQNILLKINVAHGLSP